MRGHLGFKTQRQWSTRDGADDALADALTAVRAPLGTTSNCTGSAPPTALAQISRPLRATLSDLLAYVA